MLRLNDTLRFSEKEIQEYASFGIDVQHVKSTADFAAALSVWMEILAQERPALLDKIAAEMARQHGIQLPARLKRVPAVEPKP